MLFKKIICPKLGIDWTCAL